jgi:hypothetical protein
VAATCVACLMARVLRFSRPVCAPASSLDGLVRLPILMMCVLCDVRVPALACHPFIKIVGVATNIASKMALG